LKDIKQVPQPEDMRRAIRQAAQTAGSAIDKLRTLTRSDIEFQADKILKTLDLPDLYLGFAMVEINNAFWRARFAAVPYNRRLLLLPGCLRNVSVCTGSYSTSAIQCAGCGGCIIKSFKQRAAELGYQLLIAEGTPSVVMKLIDGEADAVLGVACLDSLEKAFANVTQLGIPNIAVPLLSSGCKNTCTDSAELLLLLNAYNAQLPPERTLSYIPLLRATASVFKRESIIEIVSPHIGSVRRPELTDDPMTSTDAIIIDWLETGGKRFRPFITMAAYAVGKHGAELLASNADVAAYLPASIKALCLAIEALHKASLIHDDIEDDDAFRYSRPSLHKQYGVAPALNAGDYLVGLGYKLIASQAHELGAECVADILQHLAAAHIELCRGQGAELMWHRSAKPLRPIDAMAIYALKTAPAFEAALYAGLRAAKADVNEGLLRRYASCVGEAFQILNDLADWRAERQNKVTIGQDVLTQRPTILQAFAFEAGGGQRFTELMATESIAGLLAGIKALYSELGVFAKAEALLAKLKLRAMAIAEEADNADLQELLKFIVSMALKNSAAG